MSQANTVATHLLSQHVATNNEFALQWAKAFPRLRVFVLMCVPSYHDAEDVLQETAVAAALDFERFDRGRSFVAWVMGIARHRVLRHWREKGSAKHVFLDEAMLSRVEDVFSQLDLRADPTHEALESCLGALTARSRRLVEHRYVQGLNTEQISARTGLAVKSVYSQLYRIRQSLAECIRRRLNTGEKAC